MSKEHYIGVMSGTSMDGIDVVLCEVDENGCKLVASKAFTFPSTLKKVCLEVIEKYITLEEVSKLDTKLGMVYVEVIEQFLEGIGVAKSTITAIGLHGQTLWHAPKDAYANSIQLGNAALVASKTGISVVSDVRRGDVALGGEGAPLAILRLFSTISQSLQY